jgi:hypothetical protein
MIRLLPRDFGRALEVMTTEASASLTVANQMIIDSLSALQSMCERLKDEARIESVVVWSLKILTVTSAAATTTLAALPGFDMGATIAGAVTVAFTTIQSIEPIGVNRARKLVAARKLETVMNSTRMLWNEKLLRLSASEFSDGVESVAAGVVENLRRKTEEIAYYVEGLIINEASNNDDEKQDPSSASADTGKESTP